MLGLNTTSQGSSPQPASTLHHQRALPQRYKQTNKKPQRSTALLLHSHCFLFYTNKNKKNRLDGEVILIVKKPGPLGLLCRHLVMFWMRGMSTGPTGREQVEDRGGCYFLALAALAEFRGGVTGLPEPMPPAP